MMPRLTAISVAVAFLAAVAVVAAVSATSTASPPSSLSPSCDSLSVTPKTFPNADLSVRFVCGRQSVSDGKLSITLNGYRFADGRSLDWPCPAGVINASCAAADFPLLVNATIENVGGGNTSIGPTFTVWLRNPAGAQLANGELAAGILFPGQHPNASMTGGVYLPPGAKVSYWLVFYVPGANESNVRGWSLQYLSLRVLGYGGDWMGGGLTCPCGSADDQLVVVGSPQAN